MGSAKHINVWYFVMAIFCRKVARDISFSTCFGYSARCSTVKSVSQTVRLIRPTCVHCVSPCIPYPNRPSTEIKDWVSRWLISVDFKALHLQFWLMIFCWCYPGWWSSIPFSSFVVSNRILLIYYIRNMIINYYSMIIITIIIAIAIFTLTIILHNNTTFRGMKIIEDPSTSLQERLAAEIYRGPSHPNKVRNGKPTT